MDTAISTKGQIVIPKRLRDQWGLVTGSRVKIASTPAGIQILHTLPPQPEPAAASPGTLPIFAQLLARQQRGTPTPPDAENPDAR